MTRRQAQRNEEMLHLRVEQGKSLQEIADIYGLSRERVRQILKGAKPIKPIIVKPPKPSLEERLYSRVAKSDGCWIFQGYKTKRGYGVIHNEIKLTYSYAHRLSYFLEYGEIPEGMCVCHTCDNPSCVNPAHLFLGTHQQNMQDRDRKGRGYLKNGVENPNGRLTTEQRDEIRKLYASGNITTRELGKQFGICHQHVTKIVNFQRRKLV